MLSKICNFISKYMAGIVIVVAAMALLVPGRLHPSEGYHHWQSGSVSYHAADRFLAFARLWP